MASQVNGGELTNENYFDHVAVSQSDLKMLIKSPVKFHRKKSGQLPEREGTKYFLIGHMVDCKALTPKEFSKRYVQRPRDLAVPSHPNEKTFCELLLGGMDDLLEAYSLSGYTKPTEKDAKAKMEKWDTYLQYMAGLEGREEYTFDDMTKVTACLSSIAQNPLALRLTKKEGISQVPILFSLMGHPFRALLDRIHLDTTKRICRITDLKTTAKDLSDFENTVRRYGYHFQAAFYLLAAKAYVAALGHNVGEWTFENYIVAVETTPLHECRVYKLPREAMMDGMMEVREAIQLLSWHTENAVWNKTKEEYLNDNLCTLPWKSWK